MPTLHDFFKCNSTGRKNDLFADYKVYNSSNDFSIYYKLSGDDVEDIGTGNLPANCSLIRLPIDSVSYDVDVFKMLSHVFLVQWQLSYDCYQCRQGGGQCQTNKTNKFQCTYSHAEGVVHISYSFLFSYHILMIFSLLF